MVSIAERGPKEETVCPCPIVRAESDEPALPLGEIAANYGRLIVLGELLAGVTHSFGNVLMSLSGTMELLQLKIAGRPGLEGLSEIVDAALGRVDCGAELTQQLLEFAR